MKVELNLTFEYSECSDSISGTFGKTDDDLNAFIDKALKPHAHESFTEALVANLDKNDAGILLALAAQRLAMIHRERQVMLAMGHVFGGGD